MLADNDRFTVLKWDGLIILCKCVVIDKWCGGLGTKTFKDNVDMHKREQVRILEGQGYNTSL